MTKRFTTSGYKIYDTFHDGVHWIVNEVEAEEIVEVMNNLDLKARERSKALSKLQKENEQLKQQSTMYHNLFIELQKQLKDVKKASDLDSKDFYDLIELSKGNVFDEKLGWIHLPIKELKE